MFSPMDFNIVDRHVTITLSKTDSMFPAVWKFPTSYFSVTLCPPLKHLGVAAKVMEGKGQQTSPPSK